jgi:hypothetical protein
MSGIKVGDWTVTEAGLIRLHDLHVIGGDLHRQLEFNAIECCEILGVNPTHGISAKDIAEEIVLHGTPVDEVIKKLQRHLAEPHSGDFS